MKRLLLILLLLPLFVQAQLPVTNHRQIPNALSSWTMGTGTYTQTLPNTPEGYIECSVAGTAYLASTQAYGEWYFDFKATTGSVPTISFISNNTNPRYTFNGYLLLRDPAVSGSITLRRSNTSSFTIITQQSTSTGVTNEVWYSIKVTRSSTGVFTTYIKGERFGSVWQLVSTTGGFGTNPATDNTYTTSTYFVIDLDAGDCIRNVRFVPIGAQPLYIIKQ